MKKVMLIVALLGILTLGVVAGNLYPPVDINQDGVVDLRDFYQVALHFGTNAGDANWEPACDVNGDGTVDLRDVYKVALAYGTSFK